MRVLQVCMVWTVISVQPMGIYHTGPRRGNSLTRTDRQKSAGATMLLGVPIQHEAPIVEEPSWMRGYMLSYILRHTKGTEYRLWRLHNWFEEAVRETGVEYGLLRAVAHIESKGYTDKVSSAGAVGPMQVLPWFAHEHGIENPLDPRENILGAARFIAKLIQMFDGNLKFAIAAYHAGPSRVRKAGGVPPIKTTRRYVRDVLGTFANYQAQEMSVFAAFQRISKNSFTRQ